MQTPSLFAGVHVHHRPALWLRGISVFNVMLMLSLWMLTPSFMHAQQRKDTVDVFFASGDASLPTSERGKLDTFLLRYNDTLRLKAVSILGFCDDQGDSLSNMDLSQRRASGVRGHLVAAGVDSAVIKTVRGLGERPLRGVSTEDQERAGNRRVRIVVLSAERSKLLPDTLKVGDKVTLHKIQFVGGCRLLKSESVTAFRELLRALKEQPKYEVSILGFVCCSPVGTDGVDNDTGQENLSEVRAKTIYDSLIKNGIDPTRLSYKGMGSRPTGKGDDADRRVEVLVTGIREL